MRLRHVLFLLLAVSLFNFHKPIIPSYVPPDDDGKYKKEWRKVDSLERIGLPQSALEIVEKIYASAKQENNSDQIIKSFIYRMKFKHSREEDSFENLIEELLSEVEEQEFPTKNVMHSMLGEMYMMYYNNNMWRINNRSETVSFDPEDMKTWDLNRLADHAIKHYNLSLENKESLQNTPVKVYDEIIEWRNQPKELRPTLYDFLAHRAVDFFMNTQLSLTQPADKFELREDFYFADAKTFAKQEITTTDTFSLHFHGIKIMQDLLRFRLKEESTEALIDADLKRLDLIKTNSVNEHKDTLYLSILMDMEQKYKENAFCSEVSYRIANFYAGRSAKYNPLQKETFCYKWDNRTAMNICNRVIAKYPGSSGAGLCKSLRCNILNRNVSFKVEEAIQPHKKTAIKVNYRNFSKMHLQVAKVDYYKGRKLINVYWGEELFDEIKRLSEQIYTKTFALSNDSDFNTHSIELFLDELPRGYYLVMLSDDEQFSYNEHHVAYDLFFVSDLSYILRKNNKGNYDVQVRDRTTGKPVANVKEQVWCQEYNYKKQQYVWLKDKSYTTDEDGYCEVLCNHETNYYNVEIEFTKETDLLFTNERLSLYNYTQEPSFHNQTTIFTDRAIYRPGQTVYFKGITINTDGEKSTIVKNHFTQVTLYDVNWQAVQNVQLTTNEYGTFNGSFQLPTNLLNGRFTIHTVNGSKNILVEEYKRPKFEVEMLPFEGSYRLNDDVTVKGNAKAFAGYDITDAQVAYRVVREPRWFGWWYWYYPQNKMEIAHGSAKTDENGEFSITFRAIPDLSYAKSDYLAFRYSVIVDVTDVNGETQSTSRSLVIGYRSMTVSLSTPEKIEKENPPNEKGKGIPIVTQNLNGEFIPAKGEIKIYSFQEPDMPLRARLWERPDRHIRSREEWMKIYNGNVYDRENEIRQLKKNKEIYTTSFDTEKKKELIINDLNKWKPGRYVAEITSKDAFGQPVSSKSYFTVFSSAAKTMPVNEIDWFAEVNSYGEPGEKAQFIIGSAKENVQVLYEVEHKNKIVSKEWIPINNEQKLFDIPIKEEYRGNFSVHFSFVYDNRIYQHDALVRVPYTNKQLDIEFSTFRDKLYPGQEEEWRIKIKGKLGDKVAAEMLATLYDASLDQFAKNYWYFNIYRHYGVNLSWQSNIFTYSSSMLFEHNADPYYYYSRWSYDYFNWFGFNYWNYYYSYAAEETALEDVAVVGYGTVKRATKLKNAEAIPPTSRTDMESEEESIDKLEVVEKSVDESKKRNGDDEHEEQPKEGKVQIRTNLNETAFFYPNLQTDEDGNVIISFTIPEALTRWRMMGFAHTQDLKYGFVENELVTQKDLMVVPNAPRFFRENDKITFPVKVSNISEDDLNGKVTLELLDGITMKPVEGIYAASETKEKSFTVNAKKSTVVTWNLHIPEGTQIIAYRAIAKTNKFSDGEEKPIPVLTNRMLVTESLPLPVRGKQTKQFEFTKLLQSDSSETLKHEKLTLEFTSNPAWYAIQALPYLMEYPYECSEQTFSRYYANSIASHIANSNPKIKRVFDAWKDTPGSEALLSNLEKNQELKAVLLQETPWVLDAHDESERKRRVGLLFDLNRMANELEKALKKLQEEQTINGGWPWFKGMPESRYITQHIIAGMGHLDKMDIKNVREDNKTRRMIEKGISFMDRKMKEDYDWLKKHGRLNRDNLTYIAIHYLYGRSFYTDIPVPKSCQEAFDYYYGQAKKYWLSKSKYMQGMIALAFYRYDSKDKAKQIVASLKEHALFHEELGMYWKDNRWGYYWYQAPIETQALMVEVFSEITQDKKAVEELKVWLIKQKQTQDWKTTKATVEACYALLLQGTDWLASDEIVEVKVGNEVIDPRKMPDVKIEAGTGYFKTSWDKTEIKPEMGKVSVTNPNEVVAWGALYWQYFEQLDKITPHETPLKLNKKLFKEIITDRGKVIEPVEKTDILQVGDKIIVRIELRVDRDMEYIHMKDMRASGFEPINVISRYKWQDGLGYYESTKDAATNFFMDYMRKGTHVFEYPLRVTHQGDFSNGITTIQCMYAPEFTSHSEGVRVTVK